MPMDINQPEDQFEHSIYQAVNAYISTYCHIINYPIHPSFRITIRFVVKVTVR